MAHLGSAILLTVHVRAQAALKQIHGVFVMCITLQVLIAMGKLAVEMDLVLAVYQLVKADLLAQIKLIVKTVESAALVVAAHVQERAFQ